MSISTTALLDMDSLLPSSEYMQERAYPTVFVDLDGTLCPTEMHNLVLYFLKNLPSPPQRIAKLILYFPFLAVCVGPAS